MFARLVDTRLPSHARTRLGRLATVGAALAVVSLQLHAQRPAPTEQKTGIARQVPIVAPKLVEDLYTFRTLAGSSGAGSANGAGRNARFLFPEGAVADRTGNLFVADSGNHTIRKISPSGEVTTLAGLAGASGSDDGAGGAARFYYPSAPAIDRNGVLYVADAANHTIRRVTPAGDVTTMAGLAGALGSVDGTGSEARFSYPRGTAVDAFGNVYVVDSSNNTIRRVTSAGVVTTIAGLPGHEGSADGTGSNARFNYPLGIAVDTTGILYVTDHSNHTIRKINGDVVTTLAGTAGARGSTDATGSAARFYYPTGIAVDGSGTVYVTEYRNHTVRKITRDGVVATLAGRGTFIGAVDGTGSAARFFKPSIGAGIDSAGNLYIGDTSNHTVRKITSTGIVTTVAGQAGSGTADGTGAAARFLLPLGIAVDRSGAIFVADFLNHTVRRITAAGVVTTFAGQARAWGDINGTGGSARFLYPRYLAIDSTGTIYVAEDNNTIRKIAPAAAVSTLAGLAGTSGNADGVGTAARFTIPIGVAVDSAGIVYVADNNNHTIRKISPSGQVTTLAGLAGRSGNADGVGGEARFYFPNGVAVDSAGVVYVADNGNHTIRRITPAGEVSTLAGSPGTRGFADGIGSDARFSYPAGVAVDRDGSLLVTDEENNTIRRVTMDGTVTTVAGSAMEGANFTDGPASVARFHGPKGIAVDSSGVVYVADTGNNMIRVGTPSR